MLRAGKHMLAMLIALLTVGCSQQAATLTRVEQAQIPTECGIERWAVKTLTDTEAGRVNLTPRSATVEDLTALPIPVGFGRDAERLAPEFRTYMVTATLVEFKEETDSDIHLVIQGESGQSMIAEISDPSYAEGSRVLPQISRVRARFVDRFGQPSRSSWSQVDAPTRVTGVLFFDVPHEQRGVAPNAVELHPVVDIDP